MPDIVAVIPVRYGSQRFPGKPLAPILNKPMIQWVIEGVSQSQNLNAVVVATDHDEIAKVAKEQGVEVVMTPSDLPTGSDRVWRALENRAESKVINIQGDEPLITGAVIDQLVQRMEADDEWEMVTLGHALDRESLDSPQTAKIVLNQKNEALYFSRYPIPYSRVESSENYSASLKHVGLYGYKRDFLERFCQQSPIEMERVEGLEQLRALYLGARIPVVQTQYESWGVDVPDDIAKVEQKLRELYGD